MRIVIDLQGAQGGSRHRGIGRYCLALAQAMVRNRSGHEIIIALNGMFPDTIEPIRAAFVGLLPQENIRCWHAAGPVHSSDPTNAWRRDAAAGDWSGGFWTGTSPPSTFTGTSEQSRWTAGPPSG